MRFIMPKRRDNFDAFCGLLAGVADAIAAYLGVCLAVWVRFDSGWIPLLNEDLPPRGMYVAAAAVISVLLVIMFRNIGLYIRPQLGRFEYQIPRLARGTALTLLIALALSFVARIEDWPPYSRTVAFIAFFTIPLLVILERYILSRLELHWARHSAQTKSILVIGTGALALDLRDAIQRERRFRSRVAGYLQLPGETPAEHLEPELLVGGLADFENQARKLRVDEVILSSNDLPRARMAEILLFCERNLLPFRMIPDLYDVLTDRVRIQHVEGIPLIGLEAWPLDSFHNRMLKRVEDIVGALVGLMISAPVILIAAPLIKLSSPGPVFYRQKRVGAHGRRFTMYKLRSMPTDAEKGTGPVWTSEHDARRTRVGEFLRKWNLDELPQFWNVLKGDMSLVGPRPERPFFVEQFKNEIGRYMTRHVSRPGMTGWAQVNGLRGNTSLTDRVQHDLYYLENWSLALDFKILVRTFLRNENAY